MEQAIEKLKSLARTRAGRWAVAIAALVMAVGAAQAVARLYERAERFAQAETAVARIEAQLARGELDDAGELPQATQRELDRLEGLPEGLDGTSAELEEALREYLRTGDMEHVASLLMRADDRARKETAEAHRDAFLNTVYTFLAAAMVIALLFWKFHSAREARRMAGVEERALRDSEERFRSLVQNSSDLIAVLEPDSTLKYVTPSAERLLGYDAEDLLGTKLSEIVHEGELSALLAGCAAGEAQTSHAMELQARHHDGSWRALEAVANDRLRDPGVRGVVLNMRDVTERKALEERLRHEALHDGLTGLPNRTLFEDRTRQALARGLRKERGVALVFIDVDDFKTVNDGLGHSAGDQLLRGVAERLSSCVRASDTVARLGGDEFGILYEEVDEAEEADRLADQVLDSLRRPFNLEGREIFARASAGVVVSAPGGKTAEDLLRDADAAMYVAKARGKDNVVAFEPEMNAALIRRVELKADLERALEREELVLHYQPVMALESLNIVDIEALIRWQHPERGLLSPAEFIPLAEETGLIVPIGAWVLREACRQCRIWQATMGDNGSPRIAVNISGRQLGDESIVKHVKTALELAGLEPETLVLEVTESVLLEDLDAVEERLEALKRLGVRVAIDDFGTGYSSLSYLHRFPVDILKIDRSFIANMAGGTRESALVGTVIGLAGNLALTVVAEGVEQEAQLDDLRAKGCDLAQGFLLARPQEGDAIGRLLQTEQQSVGGHSG